MYITYRYPLSAARRTSAELLLFVFCGIVCTGAWLSAARAQEPGWPLTVAEQSDYRATSRSDQVLEFIDDLVERAPHVLRQDFAQTGEGRPLASVLVARPPVDAPLDPEQDQRLVILLLGNIHPGECDGKEALLMLLRELAQQPDHPWFKQFVFLFVPNFNADGNDRMRKDNRPGQVGPEEGMGQRANAQNLDLNRDFTKLDTPECRALVALINRWDPHLLIDMHTTNGSRHRYVLTYDVPHNLAAPAVVRAFLREQVMPEVALRMESQHMPVFYYGNFDRAYTQWETYGDEPRYGIEYFALRGRMAILAESYSYISYQQRIAASGQFVRECLRSIASRASATRQLLAHVRKSADAAADPASPPDVVPIQSEMVAQADQVVVRGFQRITDADGRRVTTEEPQDYTVDFLTDHRATATVQRPDAYVLAEGATAAADRLRRHGIRLEELSQDAEVDVEYYQILTLERAARAYQGHHAVRASVELRTARRKLPRGTLIVPLNQQLATLTVLLLEPQAVDGLLAWDLFEPPLNAGTEYPIWRLGRKP